MRFLVGDETGIVKWVRVEAQKVERLPGPRRRGDAVERLCWAGPAGARETRVAVAYASGALEARDPANGAVLGAYDTTERVRCLEVLDDDLLTVSAGGCAAVVAGWCAGSFPEAPAAPAAGAQGAEEAASGGQDAACQFTLPGPVAAATLDPQGSKRLAFGGADNDVQIFDLARGEVSWRAKNVREDSLCLRVPVRVASLQWATPLAPARSLLLCGTSDGKVRLYDAGLQRRPLFELIIGHSSGCGTGGYTGTADDLPRPVTCSAFASTRGGASWSFFVGNTLGTLREFDLRYLAACTSAEVPPGRKAHLKWANRQLPMRRGFKGIMGSIRAVDVHPSGDVLVAAGLGRFAYVFETKRRRMVSKVYLKQKLCSVLVSEEAYGGAKGSESESESEEGGEGNHKVEGPAEAKAEDDVQEGFSDDEEGVEGAELADGPGDEPPLAEAVATAAPPEEQDGQKRKGSAKPRLGKRRRPSTPEAA